MLNLTEAEKVALLEAEMGHAMQPQYLVPVAEWDRLVGIEKRARAWFDAYPDPQTEEDRLLRDVFRSVLGATGETEGER